MSAEKKSLAKYWLLVVLAIVLYAVLGKLADLAARGLERVWLRWHPAYQVQKGGAA